MTDASTGYDLRITRLMDVPRDAVWRAWTDHLTEWWCPKPWTTEVIENDMRPGGRSAMIMRGPDGEESAMEGVFLEIEPGRRIVFTNAFTAGWMPQAPFMLGYFEFADEESKTRYTAGSRHWDEATMKQHEGMGFFDGWNKVADQLEEVARRIA